MIGRVGNNQLTRSMLFYIQTQVKEQERLFEQISSNKRILRPSDDPVGVSQALRIRDQIHRTQEHESRVQEGEMWTNMTTAALDSANETWKRVNEVAISAADGTKTDADRAGMAEELEQLLQHLIQVGNTTHGGRYIFSGNSTEIEAFRSEVDSVTGRVTVVFYQGDDGEKRAQTKDGGSVTVNILGSNAGNPEAQGSFIDSQTGTNLFSTLISIRDKLLNNDTVGISGEGGILADIEQGAQSLTSAQVRLGGAQSVLELDKTRLVDDNANLEQNLSDVELADTVQLILELNNVQNVYEAALAASGRMMQKGLINYI